MLTLFLSGGVLALVTLLHGLPVAVYGLAAVLSFICTLAVREQERTAQLVTRLHAGWAAVAAATLAGYLAPKPVLADIGFLCVIFASVYIQRFGPRWFAIGMVAFLAYFIGDYLKAAPSQVGWIGFGAAVALAASHLVSTVLLPADPERDFRRAMTTIDHRINLILRQLLRMAAAPDPARKSVRTLHGHVHALRDIVLMAEGFIPQGASGALAATGAASDLAAALFDLQLAVERLVRSRHAALPSPAMVEALLDERGSLLRRMPVETEAERSGTGAATLLLLRLRDDRVRINEALGTAPSAAFAAPEIEPSGKDPDPATEGEDGEDAAEPPKRPRIPRTLQRPIQVTLACGLALGVGLALSPTRWYWAVITAFIVFNNTRSRSDTAMRAVQRAAGTLGGLFAGTAAATMLQGNMIASGVGIALLFFLGFYFLQTSYGVMIFFVTIAIALFYGLLGMFTPDLLVIRMEETVVGGIAGSLVAFFVFPVSATSGVDTAVSEFMDSLDGLIAAARKRAADENGAGDLTALSRDLDRRYSDLVTATRPLSVPWSVVTRFGQVRRKLLPFVGSAHWGRVLAQSLNAGSPPGRSEAERFDAIATDIEYETRAARAAGADLFLRRGNRATGHPAAPSASRPVSGTDNAVNALASIRELMRRLNSRSGAEDA